MLCDVEGERGGHIFTFLKNNATPIEACDMAINAANVYINCQTKTAKELANIFWGGKYHSQNIAANMAVQGCGFKIYVSPFLHAV